VKPAKIVDKAIAFWLDIVTPGRGAGESNWWVERVGHYRETPCRTTHAQILNKLFCRFQNGIRRFEQTSERASRELDIRRTLRDWDNQYPEIHHELIVRWVCGAIVSIVATSFYNGIVRRNNQARYRY
jgi:hypothetical protein